MSELAKNEYCDEWTAFAVKDVYELEGIRFENFQCAFCDTPLSPVAIYPDGGRTEPFKIAPHFKIKSQNHAQTCPYGGSTLAAYGIFQISRFENELNLEMPERLVSIRPARQDIVPRSDEPTGLASPEEIRRRVRASAASATAARQYTTGLLKTMIDARDKARRLIENLPKIVSIRDDKDRTRSVYQILATIPLRLYERASDYNRAFRRVNFAPPNDAYIYYGKATVGVFGTGLLLVADKEMAKRDSKETVPFHVHVVCDIENPENRMEAQTIERLSEAMQEHRPVYWYAYGAPALNNEGTLYELVVREPSHIYIFPRPRKPRR